MTETIIVAIISFLGAFISNYVSNRRFSTLTLYRLNELEKKQDKHNNLIERTFHLEQSMSVLEEKISVANHRIDDLERKDGNI